MACGIEAGAQGTKKSDEPSAEEAEVVTGAGEDGVDGITVDAEQEVPPEMTICLHVADHRFDGGTPAQLAADGATAASLRGLRSSNFKSHGEADLAPGLANRMTAVAPNTSKVRAFHCLPC